MGGDTAALLGCEPQKSSPDKGEPLQLGLLEPTLPAHIIAALGLGLLCPVPSVLPERGSEREGGPSGARAAGRDCAKVLGGMEVWGF